MLLEKAHLVMWEKEGPTAEIHIIISNRHQFQTAWEEIKFNASLPTLLKNRTSRD